MGFSDNLFHLRTGQNMTQEQLAMLMGVSRQAISKWESGRAYPEMDKLVRLCDVFECDLNELVRGDLSGRPVGTNRVFPTDVVPVDACGYDRCMRGCALLLSTSIAVPLLSLAVFFGTSGAIFHPAAANEGVMSSLSSLLRGSPFGSFALMLGLLAGLALASVALNRYLGFCGRFPYIEDFYVDEQRRRTHALARRARASAAIAGAVAIVSCLVKSGPLFHVSGGLASLFAWGSVAAWSLAYAGLMKRRLNVAGYNERNMAIIERREAARVCAQLPATRALTKANPEMPRLAKAWVLRQTTVASGAILSGFVLVSVVFALFEWCIWFIPLMVGAVAAALVRLYLPLVR